MATQIQFRRGTRTQHASFTGATAEVTVNTTDVSLHVHDGISVGGVQLARSDLQNVTGIVTFTSTNLNATTLNASGTGYIAVGIVTNLRGTNLNYSGIATADSISIGATQIISSGRQLQNIVSLDATTTATIESAIANAPNTFTDLNVTGVSTLGNATASRLVVSGFSTLGSVNAANLGLVGITTGLNAPGISTLSFLVGESANYTGISTLISLTGTNVNYSGIGTIANLVSTNINASGVTTSSGGFAGNLTGNVTGNLTGNVTGNINSTGVSTIANLRATNINATGVTTSSGGFAGNLTGDVTGNLTGNATGLSGNPSITVTNVTVNGVLSVGGTSVILNATQLQINDRDITLGVTTDINGVNVSNDVTANHGGIAIASTVGTPIINIPTDGVNNDLPTYKQIMWVRQGHYSGFGTDAWVFNYGVSVGNTSTVQNGSRLTVGTGFTVYDTVVDLQNLRTTNINASGVTTSSGGFVGALTGNVTGNVSGDVNSTGVSTFASLRSTNINATGIVTANTFSGSGASLTGVPVSTGISGLGANVATFLATPTSANLISAVTDETGSGSLVFATSPTLVSPTLGNATATSLVSTNLNVSGVSTLTNATGTNINYSGVGTITTLNTTNLVPTNINSSGVATFAQSNSTNLNVSGVGTIANIRGTNSNITGISTALDFNATSDINLKTNIVPITNSIEKIIKINGVSFNWKETQKPSIGVIAQNVEEVFPELVSKGDTKTVNYNGLVGALIEAVKEQQKQIDILKKEIENLKEN